MVASAALAGAGFAAFKVFQSRRSGHPGMPSGDESIMPTRSETPLVNPSLMDGLDLRRAAGGDSGNDSGNGQLLTDAPPTAAPVDVPAPAGPTGDSGWVEPQAGGACPDGYPVKAKLASGIFHAPGMLAYDRTTPDRCYRDEAAAEADGLRKAKR
jgi:hypothetical protein